MRRVTLSMAVVFAAACSGDVPVDEKVCEVACGVGFVCEAPRCVPSPETVVEVEVLAPVAGAWLSEADVTFQCRVKAPQVSRVLVKVTPADADPTEVELTKVPAQDAWTGTGTLDEGAHEAVCVVEFGPQGDVVSRTSEPVTFDVTLGAPVVTLDPIEGWFAAGSKVTVKATHSPGAQVESATLDFSNPPLHLAGVSDGANGWTFEVNVDSLSKEEVEAEFPFDVSLKDSAGNEGRKSGVIRVDTIKPKASFTSESRWLRAGDQAEVTLSVQDGGEIAAVTLSTEGTSLLGVLKGEQWSFKLPVDTLAPEGLEAELPYVVNVKDAAGNVTVLSDKFLIDTIAPTIDTPAVSRWYGAGATALVWATVVEGYGVEKATLTFDRDSTTILGTHQGGQEWSFAVDVDLLAGGPMEASNPYEIVVADVAGNETKAAGALRVDNVAPKVTKESESAWVRAGETARVSVSVVEGGALASVSLSLRDKTFAGVSTGGKWEFSVPVEEVFLSDDEELVPYVVTVTDGAGNQATIDGTLGIDVVPPRMELKPLPAWVARSSTLTVKAEIAEGGEVDPASVIVTMGTGLFQGEKGDDNIWSFEIPLASVTPANIQGPVSFTVSAADRAGNITKQDGAVHVDGTPPQVTVTGNPDATWRGTGTFNFTATVSYAGAPVVSSTLSRSSGGPSLTTAGAQSELTFIVKTADWQALGAEGLVPWTLKVVDAAGNETTKTGQFKIDRKPPSIDPKAPTAWFNTSTVPVNPVVTDGGSGPSTTFLEWDASGQRGACSRTGGTWTCAVATPLAAGTVTTNYPFKIIARDNVGNEHAVDRTLKIDKKGPVIKFEPDGKWYKRSASIRVVATVTDEGAGVGTGKPQLTISSPLPSTHQGEWLQGLAVVDILATSVVKAGNTAKNVKVKLKVADAVGNVTESESSALFGVDDTPPTIETSIAYPSGRSDVAVRDPFGSGARSKATVTITTADDGAGINSVELTRDGTSLPQTSVSGNKYTFVVDAADVAKVGGSGNIRVVARTEDKMGNWVTRNLDVAYTRKLWTASHTTYVPVAGLALGGGALFQSVSVSGSTAANVIAMERKDGSRRWSARVDGTPTTAVTVGNIYGLLYAVVASTGSGGTVSVISADHSGTNVPPDTKRSGIGQTRGGLAFGTFTWPNNTYPTTKHATVFSAGTDDYLRASSFACLGSWCEEMQAQASAFLASASYWTAPAIVGDSIYVGSSDGRIGRAKRYRHDLGSGWYETRMSGAATALESPNAPILGLAMDPFEQSWNVGSGYVRWMMDLEYPSYTASTHTGTATALIWSKNYRFFGAGPGGLFYHTSAYSTVRREELFSTVMKASPVVGEFADGNEELYLVEGSTFRAVDVPPTKTVWSMKPGGTFDATFVLDCHGIAYIASTDGTVHALVTDSVGLSRSAWPKFQHDNRNTGDANYKTWNGNTCID